MKYTPEQIKIALGIMSGRIDPERDLKYFDDAIRLHLDLPNGNVTANAHRMKAEEIIFNLINGSNKHKPLTEKETERIENFLKEAADKDNALYAKMAGYRFNQE